MLRTVTQGFIAVIVFAFASWALVPPSAAQSSLAQSVPMGGTISEIRVEGLQRIEPETVLSYLTIKAGEPFDPERIDSSLKALFNTGLFADVSLRRDGDALIIHVLENPIINRLAFEGNDIIERDTLEKEVQLRPRVVYTRTRVQNDVKRILDLYRRQGRFAATVEPKVIQQSQNRVDLVFEINEGPATKVRQVTFIGNRRFSDSRLESVIDTQASHWFSFLLGDDIYDPDRLQNDRELLRKYYLAHGYADFRVISAVAELSQDRKDFFVTFTVDEGERYKFGPTEITTKLPELDPEKLKPLVTHQEGDWYNADEVDNTINKLTDAVGNLGYAFVDIRPRVNRDRDNHVIGITYEINEGPRVYVERIDIRGNTRTEDKVIRREFRLVEGDAFNTAKLNRSRQRIRNLQFFKTFDVKQTPGSAPDKTVLQVDVEEQSTGSFNIGGGFSSSQGPIAIVQVSERNLLGKGLRGTARLLVGTITQEAQLSLTDPYFLDRNLSAGFDVTDLTRNKVSSIAFEEHVRGLQLRTGFHYNERLAQTFNYNIRGNEIKDVNDDASVYIQRQEGDSVMSSIGQSITYDKRDNRQDPADGYYMRFSTDFAGLGGDEQFIRAELSGTYYYSFLTDWTFSVGARGGYIYNISDEPLRLSNRYFIGSDGFRGFSRGGVGPRDAATNDALGGNRFYVGTMELAVPLGFGRDFGLKGILFTDVGSVWGIEDDPAGGPGINDSSSPRVTVGAGAAFKTPFGPVRVDIGYAVVKETFDDTEYFTFNFGSRF